MPVCQSEDLPPHAVQSGSTIISGGDSSTPPSDLGASGQAETDSQSDCSHEPDSGHAQREDFKPGELHSEIIVQDVSGKQLALGPTCNAEEPHPHTNVLLQEILQGINLRDALAQETTKAHESNRNSDSRDLRESGTWYAQHPDRTGTGALVDGRTESPRLDGRMSEAARLSSINGSRALNSPPHKRMGSSLPLGFSRRVCTTASLSMAVPTPTRAWSNTPVTAGNTSTS